MAENAMTTEPLLINDGSELSADHDKYHCNIPDITKLSVSDRKRLLKQLLELEEKENNLIQVPTKLSNPPNSVININENPQHKLSTLLPRYSSKSILLWFIVSCIVSILFSLYPISCLLFQDTNHWYCSDPLLNSTASILQFIFTFLMTISMIIAIYYILLHKNKKHVDKIIHSINNNNCSGDNNLSGFLTTNKDLLSYINTMNKWYIWWIMSSFCFLYLSSIIILIIASIRGKKLFVDILSQNVVYAVPFSFGPIIIIAVYLPLYIIFFSMFLYGKLCQVITALGAVQNKKSNQDLYPLLLRFRDYMLCFRFFMIFITISCGICVTMCGWNLFILMGATFGLRTSKFEIWYLLWGMIGICASVITLVCRLRLYRLFGNISLIINKNIYPLQIQCYIINNNNNINIENHKLKTFWNKYEKWINNTHSVLSLLAFVIFFNFMITDGVVEVTAYIFVTSGILLCCGNLVLQIFLFDKHNRTKILYKSLLLLITMFFIIRCNYFKNKADTHTKQHHFVIFRAIFNILATFGVLFIFIISIKKELFGYILQVDDNIMLLLKTLIVGKYKYLMLQITFSVSVINTLFALFWCIVFANNNDSNQLYFLYCFIWILPTFYWHNEIVQYLTVYIDRYTGDNKGNESNPHLVSFGLIQIFQPIVVIALCISFSYLIRFGMNELGSTPIVFCGIQLFIIIPSFVIALWQSHM